MITDKQFESWCRLSYEKVAFYNFEHPEGSGVMLTTTSSTPQVFLINGKIIEALGNDWKILMTDHEVKELCLRLWGEPKYPFPKIQKDISILAWKTRTDIEEILEKRAEPWEIIRKPEKTIYSDTSFKLQISNFGFQIHKKYIPFCSRDRINEALKEIMKIK